MEMTRYCFECGHVGPVPIGAISCCPDGCHAIDVPIPLAMQAKRGFHTGTLRVKFDGSYGRDLEGHWFYLCPADKYAAKALFERGELQPNIQGKRHDD